jgi:serine/tyrosine/threonine adenylyltransferase
MQPSGYSALPEHFFARLEPTPVARPRLIRINQPLAAELGLDIAGLDSEALAAMFSGNRLPPGAAPIAMAYAGHQFGYFVPQLGDGRAILLGEVRDRSGTLRDIQLKGSGPTPFSRNGDGRAALGPVLREYLLSEAMHALGVPATRALAAVLSGESVYREQPLPGAILTRVAASHVRVGTFQYFAARGDGEAVRRLAEYVIERHYPEARSAQRPYLALLEAVMARQALLIARWMHVGFIHGVMNTDNMALSGETIDFGPCAFMDAYDPATVFSSIDTFGRYAYANQPAIAQWNLARFAETLIPLLDPVPERALELASQAIATFPARYAGHWLEGMRRKLGLMSAEEADRELAQGLLDAMQANAADFTLTFRRLADAAQSPSADAQLSSLFADPRAYDQWALRWRSRLQREPLAPLLRAEAMREVNPAFIARNHRVEQAIQAALGHDDFSPFEQLLSVLSRPFEAQPAFAAYADPPLPAERVLQTFCGT